MSTQAKARVLRYAPTLIMLGFGVCLPLLYALMEVPCR